MGTIENIPVDGNGFYQYCTNPGPYMSIGCAIDSVSSFTITQQTTAQLNSTDFQCFSVNLISVTLNSPTLSNDFFSTWPIRVYLVIDTMTNPNSLMFSPFSTKIANDFTVKIYQQTDETIIPLSYLRSLSGPAGRYTMATNQYSILSTTSHNIKYVNDISLPALQLYGFNVVSKNVPSFVNTKFGIVTITLVPGFDRQSLLDNIITIGTTSTFQIISPIDSIPFPTRIVEATGFNSIMIDGKIEAPSSIINLSLMTTIGSIIFRNVGDDFSFNQNFPFITKQGMTIEFSGGKITTFDINVFNNPNGLILNNNQMSGTLPSIKPIALKELQIQDNQMTGSISSSYCKLSTFAFQNNKFTGKIPSCFTCYFNTVLNFGYNDLFSGNNFDTPPSTCTTIVPNIIYEREILGEYRFTVFGKDLGFGEMRYSITTDFDGDIQFLEASSTIQLSILTNSLPPPNIIKLIYNVFDPPKVFTLAWDPLQPQIETVNWSNDLNLQFDGSYFSYNTSIMSIVVGGQNCLITSTTFNQINCSILNAVTPGSKTIITFVTIGTLTTQITLNPNVLNIIKNCTADYNDCNNGGYCNTESATCICDQNHQGPACDLPFKQCSSTVNGLCNNQGSCNNQTSTCSCNNQYQGIDCGTTFKDCPSTSNGICNNFGSCQNVTGTCLCNKIPNGWQGVTCTIPLQTMSSVIESSDEGGEAIFYGWFGNVHDTPSLLIGNKDCPITSINETVIICTAPAGTGIQTVKFTQNSYPYIINNFYEYDSGKSCPNDCTSRVNGKCDSITGYCNCNSNWGGYDCSLYRNDNTGSDSGNNGGNFPSTNITINGTNGNTNLNNQQTNYEISITSLIEFDLSGNQIKNYPLLNNWSVKTKDNITKDIYQFIQTIQDGVCNITFILEDIKTTRNISFAGLQYQLESGSVKMTIIIDNYQYSSNLNTLQLQMKSIVSEIKSNDQNNCNNENIEINTVGDYDNSLNYLSIKKNAKVLSGRFINRVESDGRSTYSQTTIVSKSNDTVIIGMNLPHFIQSITIDPDFSVLISPDFKSECDNSKRNWVIPVAVCVSVAGAAAIGASAFLIYRKRQERSFNIKMRNIQKSQ